MKTFAELHDRADRSSPAIDTRWEARRRLSDKLRALIGEAISADAEADELDAASAHLEQALALLQHKEHRVGLLAHTQGLGVERFVAVAQELNPVYGLSNPLAPPLEMWRETDRAHGRVTFGAAYEGPPGHVHGGYIAAVFDQFLGFAQTLAGMSGMTGKLELRYVKPTRLQTELLLQARVTERTGRLVYVEGQMRAAGVLTAKAKAMFVGVPAGYLAR